MSTLRWLALLLALGVLVGLRWRAENEVAAPRDANQLAEVPLPTRRVVAIEDDALAVLGVDAHRFVELPASGAAPVWLYAGYYGAQRRNAQIHAPEHCYPGTGFEVVASRVRRAGDQRVRELEVRRSGQRRLVWYRYTTRSGDSFGPYGLKWDMMVSALRGRPRDAMLVRLSTPWLSIEDADGPRDRLSRAWDESTGRLGRWFEEGQRP